jgi:hypothetical protein
MLMRARRISPAFCSAIERRWQHGGVGQKKNQKKTHRGSQRPQKHMHPLELLLSITFFTIPAIHMLTDTIKSLRTDAAGCAAAERGASPAALAEMWRDDSGSRRMAGPSKPSQ